VFEVIGDASANVAKQIGGLSPAAALPKWGSIQAIVPMWPSW